MLVPASSAGTSPHAGVRAVAKCPPWPSAANAMVKAFFAMAVPRKGRCTRRCDVTCLRMRLRSQGSLTTRTLGCPSTLRCGSSSKGSQLIWSRTTSRPWWLNTWRRSPRARPLALEGLLLAPHWSLDLVTWCHHWLCGAGCHYAGGFGCSGLVVPRLRPW